MVCGWECGGGAYLGQLLLLSSSLFTTSCFPLSICPSVCSPWPFLALSGLWFSLSSALQFSSVLLVSALLSSFLLSNDSEKLNFLQYNFTIKLRTISPSISDERKKSSHIKQAREATSGGEGGWKLRLHVATSITTLLIYLGTNWNCKIYFNSYAFWFNNINCHIFIYLMKI